MGYVDTVTKQAGQRAEGLIGKPPDASYRKSRGESMTDLTPGAVKALDDQVKRVANRLKEA